MDVFLVLFWRLMRYEEGDDDLLDFSFDGAESFLFDFFMIDIIFMFDEFYLFLYLENLGFGIVDFDGLNVILEELDMSSSDSDEGMEFDVNSESYGEEDDNKKEEEEEEEEKKEDEIKLFIKWIEVD